MKIKKIKLEVKVTLNDHKILRCSKYFDGNSIGSLHFDTMFRVNTDLMSKEFKLEAAKYGYEF